MVCPHCQVAFNEKVHKTEFRIGADPDGGWLLVSFACPECKRLTLFLVSGKSYLSNQNDSNSWRVQTGGRTVKLIRPRHSGRPVPPEVPRELGEDYTEACVVLTESPKSSAALSRRCLQQLLREYVDVKAGDLNSEIKQVLDSERLPSHLADNLDAIRNIGNFAAHPSKSKSSGEIVPVEPAEAEWNLDILEQLFDFFFVQPAISKKKRDALNEKLAEIDKPPMTEPPEKEMR